ncbi:lipopolysaccharide kinase InaA family protein [Gemmata sp. JC717]|uniref:lipopolysaccharide kinase InaA family protein n=1 Tax=Gemmata algarum TaxID=2975278 RepID=UPI0021BB6ED8|nr:lipopolysaccharide kinase InaA family protein [Gemmata algarum]MDY3555816.1 lipopolysaccharide kinase InaA family protein [Gemmata algarum]
MQLEAAATVREPRVLFAPPADRGGTLTVHPAFAELFARVGLQHPASFLDLPGEVVSGHADRHVVRVAVPGAPRAFYLKRQHVVGWREKLRNWRAGFGWASRCAREAALLEELTAAGLPAPSWAAFGTHGRQAFLLVEEVADAVDLRRLLGTNALSQPQRSALARRIGGAVAAVHAAGFETPDLTAKHVLVNPRTFELTFLDWPSAGRGVTDAARADALGALHASVSPELASPTDRLRVLAAYRAQGRAPENLLARALGAAARHATRRSVRDQLQPGARPQRLVWLAGEAVCAVPEIAAVWPTPAIRSPFYGSGPTGALKVRMAGRDAVLARGRESAPLGRLRAWVRATPWRSEGVTIGRVLFHLERYGVPAPRLMGFGQRLTGLVSAEWFALYDAPPGVPLRKWRRTASSSARRAALASVLACLDALHAAGCVLTDPKNAFAFDNGRVSVADPRAVRIVRQVGAATRRRDARAAARLLGAE